MRTTLLFVIGSALGLSAFAQASSQMTTVVESTVRRLHSTLVETSRTVQAINYRDRSGATDVDFAGTALLPTAGGKAKVRSKRGTMEVEAEFNNLQAPQPLAANILPMFYGRSRPRGVL